MARRIANANQEVYELMRHVMHEHHPELEAAEVRVGIFMVSDPDETCGAKPFLEIDGKRVLAFIRKRRILENPKLGEVVMEIDEFLWQHSLDDTGRRSLLDHELQHISLCKEKSGSLKRTFFGRPKISLVNHDWTVGVFRTLMERYGRKGIDFLSLALVLDQTKEILEKHGREETLKYLDSMPIDDLVAESSSESSSGGAAHE